MKINRKYDPEDPGPQLILQMPDDPPPTWEELATRFEHLLARALAQQTKERPTQESCDRQDNA